MATAPRWVVVAVDLDGTLLHRATSAHLGEWMGHRAIIKELERRFTEGEITSADIADGCPASTTSKGRATCKRCPVSALTHWRTC